MKAKKLSKKIVIVVLIGVFLCILLAIFCYQNVKNTIIQNEQESLKSLANVNAQSLLSSLQSKRDLVSVIFSGDIRSSDEIEQGFIKLGETGTYITLDNFDNMDTQTKALCENAAQNPGTVIIGPTTKDESGYLLYMTKAVYSAGKLCGYIQASIDLEKIYDEEQALSSLQLKNEGYCVIKNTDGVIIMPSGYDEADISFSYSTGNDCTIEWIYETKDGVPKHVRKLIAYKTFHFEEESFTLYIIEDYDNVIRPVEQIAFYYCLLFALMFVGGLAFVSRMQTQQKEHALLVRELQYEKELNETLKRQEGLMQKYNHSKTMSVLTGSIAHEFNNLMTPIVLYADLLSENEIACHEMPDEINELKTSAERCGELAKQLLDYNRQGKTEKLLSNYDATLALHGAVNMIRKLIPDHIKLHTNICQTSYFIHGQVGALNQILLNLTTNAIHAMPEGGILTIQFGLSSDNDHFVRLTVSDTGCGIDPSIMPQIFHPFFTTNPSGDGTGIGLTVVKQLTEEHGGSISIRTEPQKGTLFILDFPYSDGDSKTDSKT